MIARLRELLEMARTTDFETEEQHELDRLLWLKAPALLRAVEALELPLLFYTTDWSSAIDRWEQITGTREATTKIMCDHIRAVREELEP